MSTPTSGDMADVINATAQFGMMIAVFAGVWVAYHQLKANRKAASLRRSAELAEELIVVASQLEDAFKRMRNPFDSIPEEHKDDREFMYQKRYERITEANDLFLKLREFQIRCEAVIQDVDIKKSVTELFNFRADIAIAIEELIDENRLEIEERSNQRWQDARKTLYGSWSERDELGTKILNSIEGLIDVVKPYANFSEKKK